MVQVRYGIPTDKEAIQLRLGIERGFFRDEGIDFSLETIFGGPEIAAAYDSRALEIGELGSPPAIVALSRGAHFKIIASNIRRRALQYLVVHPSISDWADLRGKTVAALSLGSCSYWFLREVLTRNKLDPDHDVNIIGLGKQYPYVVDIFARNELHAAVLSETNVSIGEDAGVFRVFQSLSAPEFCPTMQWGLVVANDSFRAEQPELVAAILRACVRSNRYALSKPEELADFGAAYYGISRHVMEKSIRRETADLHAEGYWDEAGLRQAIDLQVKLGAVSTPLNVDRIVDRHFLAQVHRN